MPGEIVEGVWLWVGELPRGVEEHRIFVPEVEEGPGGSRLLAEGQVASGWYQSLELSMYFGRRKKRRIL